MKKLTVVQVLPALESGGVERGTLEVGRYLVEHGHRSIVISAGGRMVEQLVRDGSEHYSWDIGHKSPWTLRLIPRLRHFLKKQNVDVLHARSRLPAWICYLAWKGMPPNARPHFVTTVHGPYTVNPYSAVMAKGEQVIVISKMIRDYVLAHYSGVSEEKLSLIYRGVDPASFPYGFTANQNWLDDWYREYPQTKGRTLITLPARITRWKGQEDFVDLLARTKGEFPTIHGLVVGETKKGKSHFLDELKTKAKALGVERDITFTGHRSDLREIMSISSIVFSLAREPEAFGRTTIEALSLGIPVIGYNHGGVGEQLAEVLPEGLIETGDIEAAVELVRRWLRAAPKVPAIHPFTLEKMLALTLQVYENLANG